MAIETDHPHRGPRRCRSAATTSTPTASSRRASSARCRSRGSKRISSKTTSSQAAAQNATHAIVDKRFDGRRDPGRQPQLRLWFVARARAAGDPAERFRAVVGESFSEIFFGNSVALGMPCVTAYAGRHRATPGLVTETPDLVDLPSTSRRCSCSAATGRWRSRFRRRRASRSSTAAGTRPDCCSIGTKRSTQTMQRLPYLNGWRV